MCKLDYKAMSDTDINPEPHLTLEWFYLSGTGLLMLSWKRGR